MKPKIVVVSTNQGKPDTCGSCAYTDNNLGMVALHCMLMHKEAMRRIKKDPELDIADYDKVRSWHACAFVPSQYTPRKKKRMKK